MMSLDQNGYRKRALHSHSSRVNSVSFNRDGSSVASGSEDGRINVQSVTETEKYSKNLSSAVRVRVSNTSSRGSVTR